ncbi:hypothetical protein P9112_012332 [Eukaryota sp. TZLM1-RC]
MRFRCFLLPNNLHHHLTCTCGKPLLFNHLLNCKHFDTFKCKHDRDAFSIQTTERVVGEAVKTRIDEDSGSRPPSAPPHGKPMEPSLEIPPASSKSNIMPQKISGTGPPPSSPKNANVGQSTETSTVLRGYEELQSLLDELDDEEKELRQQIMKDAKAHCEPTNYCLFEQVPPLWKQIPKIERNVRFHVLGHKEDPERVYEIPQNKAIELIKALDNLSRDTYGRGAEHRPRLTGMDK